MGDVGVIALLDTNILVARDSPGEPAPDLSGYDALVVSALSWSELTKGLHTTTELAEFKARLARFTALRETFGSGIPFDDACVDAYDRLLRHVVARGGAPRAHVLDRMIAATAAVHGFGVVTRDAAGFANLDGLVPVEVR